MGAADPAPSQFIGCEKTYSVSIASAMIAAKINCIAPTENSKPAIFFLL